MKRFILGVGAQKAGTTWLHDYLVSRDNVDMGFMKEYHVFDTKTLEECAGFRRKLDRAVIERSKNGYEQWRENTFVRTGDITPSYSGLKAETLAYIKDEFAKRDIEVFPIFLMRDPVDRLRSSMKMRFRKKNITPSQKQELAAMRRTCGEKGDRIRSNYRGTMEKLDSVFGDRVYYGFYENLFCNKSVFGICDYLGLDRKPGIYNVRKNASPSKNILPSQTMASFVKHYREQYKYCRKRFGRAKINKMWQNY